MRSPLPDFIILVPVTSAFWVRFSANLNKVKLVLNRKQGLDLIEPAADIEVGHLRLDSMMEFDSLLC